MGSAQYTEIKDRSRLNNLACGFTAKAAPLIGVKAFVACPAAHL